MPQFNTYPPASVFALTSLFLFWDEDSGTVVSITGEDLVASVKTLMDPNETVNIVSANVTLTDAYQFVVANSGSGFTITLPSAAANPGKKYYISNKGAGTITIGKTGSDTIKGATSITMVQYKSYLIMSDGVDMWHVTTI